MKPAGILKCKFAPILVCYFHQFRSKRLLKRIVSVKMMSKLLATAYFNVKCSLFHCFNISPDRKIFIFNIVSRLPPSIFTRPIAYRHVRTYEYVQPN